MFARFDTNQDGVLDTEEVHAMMEQVGFAVDDAYVRNMMEMFGRSDTNGNGVLERSEFASLWEQLGSPSVEGLLPASMPPVPSEAKPSSIQAVARVSSNHPKSQS